MKTMLSIFFLFISLKAYSDTKVLMMIPDDFMWPEYNEPKKLYEAAGFKVTTAGRFKEAVNPDRRNK